MKPRKPNRRSSLQPAAGGEVWTKSQNMKHMEASSEIHMQQMAIAANGDWTDNIYKPKASHSLFDWVIGRRACAEASDKAAVHSFMLTDLVKRGILEKQGSWWKNWKKRDFILTRDTLSYFDTEWESNLDNLRMLGTIHLSHLNRLAQVWDYMAAVRKGEVTPTTAVLAQYSPALNPSSTPLSLGSPSRRGTLTGSSRLSAVPHPTKPIELSCCFGVRCAVTGNDLFLKAASYQEAQDWISHIRNAIEAHALHQELARRVDDEMYPLTHPMPPLSDGQPEYLRPCSADTPFDQSYRAAVKVVSHAPDVMGIGVSVKMMHLCEPEDSVFVAAFAGSIPKGFLPRGDWTETFTDPNSIDVDFPRLFQYFRNKFITTESLAAGDAGATEPCEMVLKPASESDSSSRQHSTSMAYPATSASDLPVHKDAQSRKRSTSRRITYGGLADFRRRSEPFEECVTIALRQFTVLLPSELLHSTDEHVLLLVCKQAGVSEGVDAHNKLAFAVLETQTLRALELPIKLHCKTIHRRGEDLAELPVTEDKHRQCLLSLSVARAETCMAERIDRLHTYPLFSFNPLSSAHYRFHALDAQKVLVNVETHIPRYNVAIPCALLNLIINERLPPLIADLNQVKEKMNKAEQRLKIAHSHLRDRFGDSEVPAVLDSDAEFTQREIVEGEAEVTKLKVIHKGLEDINLLLDGYENCYKLYLKMLARGSAKVNAVDPLDLALVEKEVSPMPHLRTAQKYYLKRSALKKSSSLRFVPTNLNVEVLHAREIGSEGMPPTLLPSRSISSPTHDTRGLDSCDFTAMGPEADFEKETSLRNSRFGIKTESVATFPSITLGCTAAHALGYSKGGLRRLMAHSSLFERRRKYHMLHDWTSTTAEPLDAEERQRSSVRQDTGSMIFNYLQTTSGSRSLNTLPSISDSESEASSSSITLSPTMDRPTSPSDPGAPPSSTSSTSSGMERRNERYETLDLVQRLDIITSQILVMAVTQVLTLLSCAAAGSLRHRHILPRVLQTGFLVSVQSLLSTQGDELGMLEDMVAATEWLSSVKIRLVHRTHPKGSSREASPSHGPVNCSKDGDGARSTQQRKASKQETVVPPSPRDTGASGSARPHTGSMAGLTSVDGVLRINVFLKGAGLAHVIPRCGEAELHNFEDLINPEVITDDDLRHELGLSEKEVDSFRRAVARYHEKVSTGFLETGLEPEPARHSLDHVGCAGSNSGVWIRRSRQTNRTLVVDVEVDDKSAKILSETKHRFGIPTASADPESDLNPIHTVSHSVTLEKDVGAGDGTYGLISELSLTAVLFQQGINEMQAVSNTGISGNYEFQNVVNNESLQKLSQYLNKYKLVATAQSKCATEKETTDLEAVGWIDLMDRITNAVTRVKDKLNVHLILHTSDLCRQLSGSHSICCKSGKDRTSMGVTLEEARFLCDQMHVVGGRKACKTMRRFGVRRTNVEANTGQKKYAFNTLQRQFLPKCYQPPGGTYNGNVAT